MSLPDAAASAAMGEKVIKPVWFVYMDFVSDPVRGNSSGVDITVTGSGQPDLDGTFDGVSHRFVSISDVRVIPGGSDTVTAKLSGIRGLDDDDRALLADPANWRGRVARLWRMIRDENGVQQGGIQHYYTGYMMALSHIGSPDSLAIEVTIESYLAAFSSASNRTYLSQDSFDELDKSAEAAIALVNGNGATSITSAQQGMSGGGRRTEPGIWANNNWLL